MYPARHHSTGVCATARKRKHSWQARCALSARQRNTVVARAACHRICLRTTAHVRLREKRRSRVRKRTALRAPAAHPAVVLSHDQAEPPTTSVTMLAVRVVVPQALQPGLMGDALHEPVEEGQALHVEPVPNTVERVATCLLTLCSRPPRVRRPKARQAEANKLETSVARSR